ncbi:probable E3 ubiquitin-protein ligase BAH1-like 1 isoform X2 [Phoenix dactylifera]|uniref:RING-type E3 ubiquitin transferase n=1 Tax=Phoenix dactylifera TaxID=42345 RepID=A0A8B8ZIQ1_PHODC|nr:probable E3 ubiquitin-protein ligase BAH1-like 1 isoform X2 [Phoenix dactylifera]
MKFTKEYEEYMRGREKNGLKKVGLKRFKKILKRCPREFRSQYQHQKKEGGEEENEKPVWFGGENSSLHQCPDHCTVCDGTFFPSLLEEMSEVVGCFNQRAQQLLELHLASGFRKFVIWLGSKVSSNHEALIQEGKDLVSYAIINSIAMRKILKKYDKIHDSKQGRTFRSNARRLFGDFSLTFENGKPMLSCGLFDSVNLDIDLTCSICLETVFDPVSLTCGHIFCYMCCCSAASVTIVDGLKSADSKAKCPLCRREGVYEGAVHLDELKILLSRSCPGYWAQRLQTERVERVRQAKEHWESQCRAFMGV